MAVDRQDATGGWVISSPVLRAGAFGTIGLSGIVINTAFLWLFATVAGLHYLLAAALATQGSTLWNFLWTDIGVYRGQKSRRLFDRALRFFAMNNVTLLALRLPLLHVFVRDFHVRLLLANILTLTIVFLARFLVSERFIYGRVRHDDVRAN
jgi:putative flippase GtrA